MREMASVCVCACVRISTQLQFNTRRVQTLLRLCTRVLQWTLLFQFLRMTLQRQPCERLLASPKRQLIHEGPLTLLGEDALHTHTCISGSDITLLLTRI